MSWLALLSAYAICGTLTVFYAIACLLDDAFAAAVREVETTAIHPEWLKYVIMYAAWPLFLAMLVYVYRHWQRHGRLP